MASRGCCRRTRGRRLGRQRFSSLGIVSHQNYYGQKSSSIGYGASLWSVEMVRSSKSRYRVLRKEKREKSKQNNVLRNVIINKNAGCFTAMVLSSCSRLLFGFALLHAVVGISFNTRRTFGERTTTLSTIWINGLTQL